jgi:hypothetical protein
MSGTYNLCFALRTSHSTKPVPIVSCQHSTFANTIFGPSCMCQCPLHVHRAESQTCITSAQSDWQIEIDFTTSSLLCISGP